MSRHRPPPVRRDRPWLVDGNVQATLASLAAMIEAGRLDEVDRIRAAWWLRQLIATCGPHLAAPDLQRRVDPAGRVPPAPDITALRFWIGTHARSSPRGALGRLARLAGIHGAEVSKFRAGSCLTVEKLECLAAALIASGWARATGSGSRTPTILNPKSPQQE